MNKVLYAREGAKSIMDRTFADIPWQVRVEVDGVEVEVPEVRTSKSLVLKHYQIVTLFSFFLEILVKCSIIRGKILVFGCEFLKIFPLLKHTICAIHLG